MSKRDLLKVYVFRESALPLISSYGSYDTTEFQEELQKRVTNNERVCTLLILKEIMKFAQSLRNLGDTKKSLATLHKGLSMVLREARPTIYAASARMYIDTGNFEKASEMILKALEINPQHQWAYQLKIEILSKIKPEIVEQSNSTN